MRSVSGIDVALDGASRELLWPTAFAGDVVVLVLLIVIAFFGLLGEGGGFCLFRFFLFRFRHPFVVLLNFFRRI